MADTEQLEDEIPGNATTQTHEYKKGDIVWVKLHNSDLWWPGEVTTPEEFTFANLMQKPFAIVTFFNEITYEQVPNPRCIQPFECERKLDFVNRIFKRCRGVTIRHQFFNDLTTAQNRLSTRQPRGSGEAPPATAASPPVVSLIQKHLRSDNQNSNDGVLPKANHTTINDASANASSFHILDIGGQMVEEQLHHPPIVQPVAKPTPCPIPTAPTPRLSIDEWGKPRRGRSCWYVCSDCGLRTTALDVVVMHRRLHAEERQQQQHHDHQADRTALLTNVNNNSSSCGKTSNNNNSSSIRRQTRNEEAGVSIVSVAEEIRRRSSSRRLNQRSATTTSIAELDKSLTRRSVIRKDSLSINSPNVSIRVDSVLGPKSMAKVVNLAHETMAKIEELMQSEQMKKSSGKRSARADTNNTASNKSNNKEPHNSISSSSNNNNNNDDADEEEEEEEQVQTPITTMRLRGNGLRATLPSPLKTAAAAAASGRLAAHAAHPRRTTLSKYQTHADRLQQEQMLEEQQHTLDKSATPHRRLTRAMSRRMQNDETTTEDDETEEEEQQCAMEEQQLSTPVSAKHAQEQQLPSPVSPHELKKSKEPRLFAQPLAPPSLRRQTAHGQSSIANTNSLATQAATRRYSASIRTTRQRKQQAFGSNTTTNSNSSSSNSNSNNNLMVEIATPPVGAAAVTTATKLLPRVKISAHFGREGRAALSAAAASANTSVSSCSSTSSCGLANTTPPSNLELQRSLLAEWCEDLEEASTDIPKREQQAQREEREREKQKLKEREKSKQKELAETAVAAAAAAEQDEQQRPPVKEKEKPKKKQEETMIIIHDSDASDCSNGQTNLPSAASTTSNESVVIIDDALPKANNNSSSCFDFEEDEKLNEEAESEGPSTTANVSKAAAESSGLIYRRRRIKKGQHVKQKQQQHPHQLQQKKTQHREPNKVKQKQRAASSKSKSTDLIKCPEHGGIGEAAGAAASASVLPVAACTALTAAVATDTKETAVELETELMDGDKEPAADANDADYMSMLPSKERQKRIFKSRNKTAAAILNGNNQSAEEEINVNASASVSVSAATNTTSSSQQLRLQNKQRRDSGGEENNANPDYHKAAKLVKKTPLEEEVETETKQEEQTQSASMAVASNQLEQMEVIMQEEPEEAYEDDEEVDEVEQQQQELNENSNSKLSGSSDTPSMSSSNCSIASNIAVISAEEASELQLSALSTDAPATTAATGAAQTAAKNVKVPTNSSISSATPTAGSDDATVSKRRGTASGQIVDATGPMKCGGVLILEDIRLPNYYPRQPTPIATSSLMLLEPTVATPSPISSSQHSDAPSAEAMDEADSKSNEVTASPTLPLSLPLPYAREALLQEREQRLLERLRVQKEKGISCTDKFREVRERWQRSVASNRMAQESPSSHDYEASNHEAVTSAVTTAATAAQAEAATAPAAVSVSAMEAEAVAYNSIEDDDEEQASSQIDDDEDVDDDDDDDDDDAEGDEEDDDVTDNQSSCQTPIGNGNGNASLNENENEQELETENETEHESVNANVNETENLYNDHDDQADDDELEEEEDQPQQTVFNAKPKMRTNSRTYSFESEPFGKASSCNKQLRKPCDVNVPSEQQYSSEEQQMGIPMPLAHAEVIEQIYDNANNLNLNGSAVLDDATTTPLNAHASLSAEQSNEAVSVSMAMPMPVQLLTQTSSNRLTTRASSVPLQQKGIAATLQRSQMRSQGSDSNVAYNFESGESPKLPLDEQQHEQHKQHQVEEEKEAAHQQQQQLEEESTRPPAQLIEQEDEDDDDDEEEEEEGHDEDDEEEDDDEEEEEEDDDELTTSPTNMMADNSALPVVNPTLFAELQQNGLSSEQICAVLTRPIPGYSSTFMLCSLVDNKLKPINNVALYLDREKNHLVPVPPEALTEPPRLADGHPLSTVFPCVNVFGNQAQLVQSTSGAQSHQQLLQQEVDSTQQQLEAENGELAIEHDENGNGNANVQGAQTRGKESVALRSQIDGKTKLPHGNGKNSLLAASTAAAAAAGGEIHAHGNVNDAGDVDDDDDEDDVVVPMMNMMTPLDEDDESVTVAELVETSAAAVTAAGVEEAVSIGPEFYDDEDCGDGQPVVEANDLLGLQQQSDEMSGAQPLNVLQLNVNGHNLELDPSILMSIAQNRDAYIEINSGNDCETIVLHGAQILQAAQEYLQQRDMQLVNIDDTMYIIPNDNDNDNDNEDVDEDEVDASAVEESAAVLLAAPSNDLLAAALANSDVSDMDISHDGTHNNAHGVHVVDDVDDTSFMEAAANAGVGLLHIDTNSMGGTISLNNNNLSLVVDDVVAPANNSSFLTHGHHHHVLPPPPGLTPPITARTNETNALLDQTPIMSTLENPSAAGLQLRRPLPMPVDANLDDSLAVIGVMTASHNGSGVPTSLELPITITNPAIAPRVASTSVQPAPATATAAAISPSADLIQYTYQ